LNTNLLTILTISKMYYSDAITKRLVRHFYFYAVYKAKLVEALNAMHCAAIRGEVVPMSCKRCRL